MTKRRKKETPEQRAEWLRKIAIRHGNERAILDDGTVATRSRNRPCGNPPLNALIRPGFERPAHVSVVVKS